MNGCMGVCVFDNDPLTGDMHLCVVMLEHKRTTHARNAQHSSTHWVCTEWVGKGKSHSHPD